MVAIAIGSLWFLCGAIISVVLLVRFVIAIRKREIVLRWNWRRVALFAGLMIAAQVAPTLLMDLPRFANYAYLWPIAYSLNLFFFMLLLRVVRIRFSKAESLFFIFPLVPGIIFWVVQKESMCQQG